MSRICDNAWMSARFRLLVLFVVFFLGQCALDLRHDDGTVRMLSILLCLDLLALNAAWSLRRGIS